MSFYGKFRGVVTDVMDPLMIGRIRASVPDVLGDGESGWALPSMPFGGRGHGSFGLPAIGAAVWIEFEQGDPALPIWSGTWWTSVGDVPPELVAAPYQKTMIKTGAGHSITLDDTPGTGGITLETATGQRIVLTTAGIEIANGVGAVISVIGTKTSIR